MPERHCIRDKNAFFWAIIVNMLIAHVDESYSKEQNHYFIGAAVAEQTEWEKLDNIYDNLRKNFSEFYDLPLNIEFHGHEMMGGAHQWKKMRGRHREIANLYKQVLKASADLNIFFLFKGMDVKRQKERYYNPYPPYLVTMTYLLESIDEEAGKLSEEECIVIADVNSLQDKLQERFNDYKKIGTFGYKHSTLTNLSSPLNFADSSRVNGLQLIDTALYIHQRCQIPPDNEHPKAKKTRNNLWRVIKPQVAVKDIWRP